MTPSNYPHDTPNYDENHSCMKRDYPGRYYMDTAICGDGKHVAFVNGNGRFLNNNDNGQRVAWGAFDPVKSCWWLKPAAFCSGWYTPNLSPQTSARFSYVVSKVNGQLLMHTECLLWTKPESIALTWPAPGDFCWNASAVAQPVAPAPIKRAVSFLSTDGRRHYTVHTEWKSWNEAQAACVTGGGRLATFETPAEWADAAPQILSLWQAWAHVDFQGINNAYSSGGAPTIPAWTMHVGVRGVCTTFSWQYTSGILLPPDGSTAWGAPHQEPWRKNEPSGENSCGEHCVMLMPGLPGNVQPIDDIQICTRLYLDEFQCVQRSPFVCQNPVGPATPCPPGRTGCKTCDAAGKCTSCTYPANFVVNHQTNTCVRKAGGRLPEGPA